MATVAQAAALLDAKYGPDWPERIDLDTLNQGSSDVCVAGQLDPGNVGEYGANGAYKDRTVELSAVLGEFIGEPFGPFGGGASLTNEWKELIRERLGIRTSPVIIDGEKTIHFDHQTTFVLDEDILTIRDYADDVVVLDISALR